MLNTPAMCARAMWTGAVAAPGRGDLVQQRGQDPAADPVVVVVSRWDRPTVTGEERLARAQGVPQARLGVVELHVRPSLRPHTVPVRRFAAMSLYICVMPAG
jgi:hypothetical protein